MLKAAFDNSTWNTSDLQSKFCWKHVNIYLIDMHLSDILTRIAYLQACWQKDVNGFPTTQPYANPPKISIYLSRFYDSSNTVTWGNPAIRE